MRRKRAVSSPQAPATCGLAHHLQHAWPVWLLSVVLLLSGCGLLSSHSSTARSTPTPSSTQTLQTVQAEQHRPVTVQVSLLQEQGTLGKANLTLAAQVIVTNHTTKSVHLFQTCQMPGLFLSLTPLNSEGTTGQEQELIGSQPCHISSEGIDIGTIASGNSSTWKLYVNLNQYDSNWQPGTYLLSATVPSWHQGTLGPTNGPDKALPCAPGSNLLCGSAQGQTIVTLT